MRWGIPKGYAPTPWTTCDTEQDCRSKVGNDTPIALGSNPSPAEITSFIAESWQSGLMQRS